MIDISTFPEINGYYWESDYESKHDKNDLVSIFCVNSVTGEVAYELSPFYGSKAVTVLGPRDNDELAPRFISFDYAAKYVKERIEK